MCLYWKQDGSDLVVAEVYVDDLLATGTNAAAVDRYFTSLGNLFIKDLGHVNKFLGMRVAVDDDGSYVIDQEGAINDLLREHGLDDANSTRTPIGADCYEVPTTDSALLIAEEGEGPSIRSFQSLVGSLLWVARCTRSDIAFAVHKATRQTHQPRVHDFKLAKRIARYLKGTRKYKLPMTPTKNAGKSVTLEFYSDADYAADKADRKSLTGGVIRLNGMAEQARELLGIRQMLCEVGLPPGLPMTLHVDKQAAVRRGVIPESQAHRYLMTKAVDAAKLALLCVLMNLE
ncbi:unnamed protein product [Peronospora effusa]|nr:unnamed protein product [Peronospora effusa]